MVEMEVLVETVCQQGLAVGLTIYLMWFFTKQYQTMTDRMNVTLELLDKCLERLRKD